MSKRVQTYFRMLQNFSGEELDQSAKELVSDEKQDVARLIAHLAEIGERDYHVELGYKTLFLYCTLRLNLGEGTVYRRTQVARVCRRFPQILEALHSGRLHLTAASLIAPHLTEENVDDIITKAERKTKREINEFLVTLAPQEEFKSSVRKQPARSGNRNQKKSEGSTTEDEGTQRGVIPYLSEGGCTPDILRPATEDRYNFRFNARKTFAEKFERMAEVLGVEHPHQHLEELFERGIEAVLDKEDPKRKLERRRQREEKKQAARSGEEDKERSAVRERDETEGSESANRTVSRYVPAEVRERVLEKAGYRCEFYGPDGSRCRCRTGLQIEHTLPFAVYRTHDERFLKVFCSAHNRYAAKRYYGSEFIQQKIDAAKCRSKKGDRARVRSASAR